MSEPITEDALERDGWSIHGLYASKLLPPVNEGAAIVEMRVGGDADSDEWNLSLIQGMPGEPGRHDDHVTITSLYPKTMDQLRRIESALKGA